MRLGQAVGSPVGSHVHLYKALQKICAGKGAVHLQPPVAVGAGERKAAGGKAQKQSALLSRAGGGEERKQHGLLRCICEGGEDV